MLPYTSRLTSALYLAILILFFLPFISIKCNHEEWMKVKGIELATGFKIGNHSTTASEKNKAAIDSATNVTEVHSADSGEQTISPAADTSNSPKDEFDGDIERNNLATLALLLAVCGFVLSLLMQWRKEMLLGILGLAGMMTLFLMRVQLDNKYTQEAEQNSKNVFNAEITIEYETGYWLVIVCFLLIAALNIYNYIEQMKNGITEVHDGVPH